MTKLLAAALLAAISFTAMPASAGCTDYLLPGPDHDMEPLVERHPDGSVTIHPSPVTGFVNCVV